MKYYLLGAANPETIRMIRAVESAECNAEFPGLLDNDPTKHGLSFHGLTVLGGSEIIPILVEPDVRFVSLVTGSTLARYESTTAIVQAGGVLGNFIHPSVDLTLTRWGVGNYVQEAVIVQAGVRVGDNVSLHMGAVIGHETSIGHSVFIAHAVSISGSCEVGDGTFVGTNATILPRLRLGKWVTVGAGAVVTRDVPDYAVVVGNPARVIRTNDVRYTDGAVNVL